MIEVPGTELREIITVSELFASLVDKEMRATVERSVENIGHVLVAQTMPEAADTDDLNVMLAIWRERVTQSLLPQLQAIVLAGIASQIRGVNTAMGEPVITEFDEDTITRVILAGAENRLSNIGDSLWETARRLLSEAIEQGASIPTMAARVREALDVTRARATTIARTEVIGASNKSSIEVMRATGLVAEKKWLATFDSRVRLTHIAAHGQTVRLDDAFIVGAATLDHPGDPAGEPGEIINCRCAMSYIVDEDSDMPLAATAHARESVVLQTRGTLSTKASASAAAPTAMETTVDWYIEKNHEACTEERSWAVVKTSDGSVEGCHETREDAVAQMRTLLENEARKREDENSADLKASTALEVGEGECPPGFRKGPDGACETMDNLAFIEGVAVVEGVWTGDGRQFAPNALTWEDPNEVNIPLQWQKETNHGSTHDVTVNVGRLTELKREGNRILVKGYVDGGSDDGAEIIRRLKSGTASGVSIVADDPEQAEIEFVYPDGCPDLDTVDNEELDQLEMRCFTPDRVIFHSGRIRALTIVDTPAFVEASIRLVESEEDESDEDVPKVTSQEFGDVTRGAFNDIVKRTPEPDVSDSKSMMDILDELEPLIAASHSITIPDVPPAEWFDEPQDLPPFGAITVTDEGRVYGLLAPRNVAHRSYQNKRVTVPMGNVDYSRWMNRETIVQGGKRIMTGAITMDCGHASTDPRYDAQVSMDHYDNSCSIVATARIGENKHGVWVAGALLPDVTPAQITRMLACQLSGDWRKHREKPGWRELVGALLVPVPGFPTAARHSVRLDHGELVASTVPMTWRLSGDLPEPAVEDAAKDDDKVAASTVDTTEERSVVEEKVKTVTTEDFGLPSWDDIVKRRELRSQIDELAKRLEAELGIVIGD